MEKNEIGFGDVWLSGESPYISENDSRYIIQYENNSELISNDQKIFCDRVELIRGLGVYFYYQNHLTRYIKCATITVECNENLIVLKNKCNLEKIAYLYFNTESNPSLVSLPEITNLAYEVGDIIYPSKLYLFNGYGKNPEKELDLCIISALLSYDLDKKNLSEEIESVFRAFSFEVIGKVSNFYQIKLCVANGSMSSLREKVYFAYDSMLLTKEELVVRAIEVKKCLKKVGDAKNERVD